MHLPGTVGRLLKQIRDLERVAPLFVKAGLVRAVERPEPDIDLRASGIATQASTTRTIGGFLYGAAAVRCDLLVEHNAISTAGQDSACEIDDINYENQSKRLALVAIRQAYTLADRAVCGERARLIFLDTPLLMDRGMVPPANRAGEKAIQAAYTATLNVIQSFWITASRAAFPVEPDGPGHHRPCVGALRRHHPVGAAGPAFAGGRSQSCRPRRWTGRQLAALDGVQDAILGVGERRFVHGILGSFTRTAAFRMNVHAPRMEPGAVVELGVIGLHFRAGQTTEPRLMQLVGDAPAWTRAAIDEVVGHDDGAHGRWRCAAAPLPVQLAERGAESPRALP